MREWKETSAAATVEIARLKDELVAVKEERDTLLEVARGGGKLVAHQYMYLAVLQIRRGNRDNLGKIFHISI